MSSSRSRFYVETPTGYAPPPAQRHSMYVNQSEVESSVQKQDLSSASSSNTLPSTSGSVDRLTGLSNEKKTHRFFTLKPKTSFSLRPFFSTNSLASLSPSKTRRRTETASRRDSYVQTDDNKRVYDEVGVQTQNASTVDVPVQTCSNEWEEGDTCIGRKSPAIQPTFPRFPYGSYSTRWSLSSRSKPPGPALHDSKDNKNSYVAPLDSSKLLKYASPLDSADLASKTPSVKTSGEVKSSDSVSPVKCLLSPVAKPVKSLSEKDITTPKNYSGTFIDDSSTTKENCSINVSTSPSTSTTISGLKDVKPTDFPINSISYACETPENKKRDHLVIKSSSDTKVNLFRTSDSPTSVLKTDRTDSPKPSKPKSVHFQLSDSNAQTPTSKLDSSSSKLSADTGFHKPRNVDQEFEELLKNLDILSDEPSSKDAPVSTAPIPDLTPKQNYISPDFKSALDALKQDFLSPIPESELNQDENSKVNPVEISTNISETPFPEKDNFEEKNLGINLLDKKELINTFTPTCAQDKKESNISVTNDESYDSTSPTSAKLDANVETTGKPGEVHDKENIDEPVKTVFLPTLPSFFEASSECENLVPDKIIESNLDSPYSISADLSNKNNEDMLSRSSSRSSMRSNPRSDFEECLERTSKFDSCENLDQLEEEIIRSLYSPSDENFNMEFFAPAAQHNESPSPNNVTDVRRVILDRLLSGESVDEIMPGGTNIVGSEGQLVKSTDVRKKYKRGKKYTATLSKYEVPELESYPTSYFNIQQNNAPLPNSTLHSNASSLSNTPSSEIDTNPPSSGLISPVEKSVTSNGITNTNLINNPSTNMHAFSKSSNPSEEGSGKCDFAHCLRPSKIQNSSFLADISSKSCNPLNQFVEKPAQFSVPFSKRPHVPSKVAEKENSQLNEKCDYANCLKPSQVQNSIFTAELSEITANKSSNFVHEPVTPGNNVTAPIPTNLTQTLMGDSKNPEITSEIKKTDLPEDDTYRHVSEMTIILQTPSKSKLEAQNELKEMDKIETLTPSLPVHSDNKCWQPPDQTTDIQTTIEQTSEIVPPPPPPPPPSFSLNRDNIQPWKEIKNSNSSDPKIQDQRPNLVKNAVESIESKANKTPVVLELEKRFEKRSQSDPEVQFSKLIPPTNSNVILGVSDLDATKDKRSENNNGSSDRFSSTNLNSYKTENNGFVENKFYSPSLVNGNQNQNGFSYSSNTVITNEPPPHGAVLVDKKVTVEGDKVHTDKYYALPVKEVLKETTSTTKFIPAPPKYDGIGPTEDGIPIGLRNSVKKENMHNWYKTMFKSLHKADSSNDPQEYIIGYSSEPESSHRDKVFRKKSATLDNRSNNNTSHVHNNNFGQSYIPASAKSSIEIYNVKPRPIEDYEPGQSSVTDDEIIVGSKRFLPPMNVPKPSYEFKNGYEQENHFTKKVGQPDPPTIDQQKTWYKEIQLGKDIPQHGLGKSLPEKPKEPVIGPLPPPPLNYNGPTIPHQATRPLTLPSDYAVTNGNGVCHQMNGVYEIQMRQAIHSELHQRLSPSSSQVSSPTRSILKSPCKSPDLKIPAQALFDFKAESPKEIPLKKGDNVLILRQLDKNWYEGEKQGIIGIFPINYIEIIPPEHASLPQSSYEGVGKVLYDFTAHTPVELTVKKHDTVTLIRRVDSNWFEAQLQNKKGIIPVTYLHVLKEPIGKTTPLSSPNSYSSAGSRPISREGILKTVTPSTSPYSNTSSPSILTNGRNKLQTRNKKNSNLIEPAMYRAMYSYFPQNSDELELAEGDTIYVVEMCDDGWYVGTSVRTGVFGIFPGNYVEKV